MIENRRNAAISANSDCLHLFAFFQLNREKKNGRFLRPKKVNASFVIATNFFNPSNSYTTKQKKKLLHAEQYCFICYL